MSEKYTDIKSVAFFAQMLIQKRKEGEPIADYYRNDPRYVEALELIKEYDKSFSG